VKDDLKRANDQLARMTKSRNEVQRKLEEKTSAEARIEEEKRAAIMDLQKVKADMDTMRKERLSE
jgi:hypothetical protein